MEIRYLAIVTKKVGKVWVASTETTNPFKSEVTMEGKTEEIAKQKLINFFNGVTYKHLDNTL